MFYQKFKENIKKNNLFPQNSKLVVAVSGGPDSVCLLYLLNKLRKEYPLSLLVAHVNYGLRGKEADQDALFVAHLAKRFGLPFFLLKANSQTNHGLEGKKEKENLEAHLRQIRYRFFEKVRREERAHFVAVAHNLNDQAETIIMNFLRGSSFQGLSGMKEKSGKIIRPLLLFSREEILQYLKEEKAEFRLDQTNFDQSFTRNRIRYSLIPYLKENFNPQIFATMQNNAFICQDDADFLKKLAKIAFDQVVGKNNVPHYLDLSLSFFIRLPSSIQNHLLFYILKEKLSLPKVSSQQILTLKEFIKEGKTGNAFDIFPGLQIKKSYDKIIISLQERKAHFFSSLPTLSVNTPGKTLIWSKKNFLEIAEVEKAENPSPSRVYIDALKTGGKLKVRTWQKGDYFYPQGLEGRKKLQDFFTDEKIEKEKRHQIPLLVNAEDEIIWVMGKRPDTRFAADQNSQKIWQLTYKNNE